MRKTIATWMGGPGRWSRSAQLRSALWVAPALLILWTGVDRVDWQDGPTASARLIRFLPWDDRPADVSFSLIAFGDAGMLSSSPNYSDQLVVGEALQRESRRAAIDGLVLLGDNFYPDGLTWDALETRIEQNLVAPYCELLDLSGVLSSRVAGDCEGSPDAPPIFAVFGNHDHRAPESSALQRNAVPWFVANWRAQTGLVETIDLGGGVSLIALDSPMLMEGDELPDLAAAIASTAGPWRIIAAHHPIVSARAGGYSEKWSFADYVDFIEAAIEASGVPVHLYLSGHDHYLGATHAPSGRLPLNVIAGSGAQARDQEVPDEGLLYRWSELGFARVDVVESEVGERLEVTLLSLGEEGQESPPEPHPHVRFSIDPHGDFDVFR